VSYPSHIVKVVVKKAHHGRAAIRVPTYNVANMAKTLKTFIV